MSLLDKQTAISNQFPMPVVDANDTYRVTAVVGESVQFIVASTNVNDAGSAAGTVVYAILANSGVLNTSKDRVGNVNDTSFAFVTGTALTTMVGFPFQKFEIDLANGVDRATRMANIGALLSNGQFVLDHRSGLIIGKKATTGASDTAGYSYRAHVSSGGGGTQYTEDSVASSGDTGTVVLAVRNDAGTALAANGDYSFLQVDSTGALRTAGATGVADDSAFSVGTTVVQPIGMLANETASDSVNEGDVGAPRMTLDRKQLMASSYVDDTAFTPAGSSSYFTMIGGEADDTATDLVDEGDGGAIRMSVRRAMYNTLDTLIAGENQTVNRMMVEQQYSYQAVVAADTQVKASAGFLHTVTFSCNDAAPTAGSIIIYDNTAESGTVVFNHTFTTTPFVPFTIILDYVMTTGIYIGFTTTADVNVSLSYR